jgi:hypothetical protein
MEAEGFTSRTADTPRDVKLSESDMSSDKTDLHALPGLARVRRRGMRADERVKWSMHREI